MNASDLEQMVRRLAEGVPAALGGARQELEGHFRNVLESGLARLDLATRSEFDAQSRLLERTRVRAEQLERRLTELEQRLAQLEQEAGTPG